jgi:hypothetical protein
MFASALTGLASFSVQISSPLPVESLDENLFQLSASFGAYLPSLLVVTQPKSNWIEGVDVLCNHFPLLFASKAHC